MRKLRKVEIRMDFTTKQRSNNRTTHLVLIIILCSLIYFMQISDETTENVTYRSELCQCDREIVVSTKLDTLPSIHWCSEEASMRGPNQKVLSYTIFGGTSDDDSTDPRYQLIYTTIPQQVKQHYPDWRMRVYFQFRPDQKTELGMLCNMYCNHNHVDICDANEILNSILLEEEGASAPVSSDHLMKLDRLNRRYLSLLDPNVDVLMSRDADSEINSREVAAVNQWLDSHFTFHVMRDHPDHVATIMAGMFGAKLASKRSVIESLTKAMIRSSTEFQRDYNGDQYILDLLFWPTVKDDAMIHDSYHCQSKWNSGEIFPFPTQRDPINGTFVSDRSDDFWPRPSKCPMACRPPNHQDWQYC